MMMNFMIRVTMTNKDVLDNSPVKVATDIALNNNRIAVAFHFHSTAAAKDTAPMSLGHNQPMAESIVSVHSNHTSNNRLHNKNDV